MKEWKRVDDFENWTQVEVATAIGTLMRDLRGNWGYEYDRRIKETIRLLHELKNAYERTDTKERFVDAIDGSAGKLFEAIESDISTAEVELADKYDGRVFRGCSLYEFRAKTGQTDRVELYLYTVLTHPENTWMEIDDDE